MAALGSARLVCKVCSSPVPNPSNRRKLSSAASGRVAETLSISSEYVVTIWGTEVLSLQT